MQQTRIADSGAAPSARHGTGLELRCDEDLASTLYYRHLYKSPTGRFARQQQF
jgi:hypothetical protein